MREESRSLGYAHWPELWPSIGFNYLSLDHWDMRTGRNHLVGLLVDMQSLDHWDMRTGRNYTPGTLMVKESLDHWDMRTGRNW